MKKVGVFLLLTLVLSMFAVSFVSAADPIDTSGVTNEFSKEVLIFLNGVVNVLNPILKATLGDVEGNDPGIFLVKVLLFLVMLSILYIAVEKVPVLGGNQFVLWLVSVAIAILATRFLTTEALVNLVWLPSGVVGIALTSLLPFVIYFFFVMEFESKVIRRSAWALFAVLFVVLALARWTELSTTLKGSPFNLGWIYLIVAALALLSLVFDGTIQSMFARIKGEKAHSASKSRLHDHYRRELVQHDDDLKNTVIDRKEYEKRVKKTMSDIKAVK